MSIYRTASSFRPGVRTVMSIANYRDSIAGIERSIRENVLTGQIKKNQDAEDGPECDKFP
jgi:hypothetical protein